MKNLVSITVSLLWMLFALSSCATHDAHVAAPRQIQMHIFFTEENNKVTILRVRRTPPPAGGGNRGCPATARERSRRFNSRHIGYVYQEPKLH